MTPGKFTRFWLHVKAAAVIYFVASSGIDYCFAQREKETNRVVASAIENMTKDAEFARYLARAKTGTPDDALSKARRTYEFLNYMDIVTILFE